MHVRAGSAGNQKRMFDILSASTARKVRPVLPLQEMSAGFRLCAKCLPAQSPGPEESDTDGWSGWSLRAARPICKFQLHQLNSAHLITANLQHLN